MGKLDPKSQNCSFKLKFDTYTTVIMQSLAVVFTFSFLDWKYPFWANLVQKLEVVISNLNFVVRLI